uniref:WD repeat-containing protein 97 isoform X2 n=1 Tax=Pristiophorus japonicus TaxID=55135 RepID=UPI00398E7A73
MESVEMLKQEGLDNLGQSAQHLTMPKTTGDQESIEEKARRMWATLREVVHNSIEKIKRSDWKPLELEHGIQHVQRVMFKKAIHQVMCKAATNEVICMVSKTEVCVYHCDGRKKQDFRLREPLEGLVCARQINRYVAWTDYPQLKVLNLDFQTISSQRSRQDITCCLYNEDLNEIVTAGTGYVSSWHFYFGCRDLMCDVTVSEGLTPSDVFTELALERSRVLAAGLPRTQRCYAVCGTGIAVIDLPTATLLTYEKNLHDRKITGITLFEALRCVVTSSRDGNIKIWDESWNLQMVFVGHRGPITALASYPHGPYLLSASEDGTMRAWSLELADQVDEIRMGVTVSRLGTELGHDSFFSYANQQLDLWTIVHLYKRHTTIGYPVTALKVGNIGWASHFPVRAACSGADGTARLVSPDTGNVIASLLLEHGRQVADLEYCLPREALLVLTDQGDLLKANSLTNPMRVLMEVPGSSQVSRMCCFCVYALMANLEMTHTRWQQAVAGGSEEKIRSVAEKDSDRLLLITGHLNGFLSVLDWSSGKTQSQVQAHESGKVLAVVAEPENQYLISSGEDNAVKVWRVFPFAQESLSLLMSFYGAHPPTHLCVLKNMFVVALQNPACAVHTIVMYDLRKKIRKDHHPANDHKHEITDLSASPELKIFASASRDRTVKFWDRKNQLLRIVHLKAVADNIAFCNDEGDLLLGIERDLYHMGSIEYLTQPYLLRIACRDHLDPVSDGPVPISRTVLNSLSVEDRQRLSRSYSSKYSLEHSLIVSEELDEDTLKKQEQLKEAYALLAAREQEILLIQRGELKSKRKPPRTKEIQEEGFRRYMQLFYVETPRIKIPEHKIFNPDEMLIDPTYRTEYPYKCADISKGFFPPLALPEPWDEVSDEEKMARGLPSGAEVPFIPVSLDGYIPNSIFLRLLWPLEPWGIHDESETQLKVEPVSEVKAESKPETKLKMRPSTELEPSGTSSELSSSFLEKLERVMEKERLKAKELSEGESQEPKSSGEKEQKSSKRGSAPTALLRRTSVRVTEVDPSPPLPKPAEQFKKSVWFNDLFPTADAGTFPAGLDDETLAEMIIRHLPTARYGTKEGIAKALVTLLTSRPPDTTKLAHEALIAALNGSNPPRQEIQEERDFILTALWALKELMPDALELLVELMAQFLQCDIILRNTIKLLLDDIGLQDPHDLFEKELNSWATSDGTQVPNKEKLWNLSRDWLRKWIRIFKNHVRSALKSLKQGKTLKASVPVPLRTTPSMNSLSNKPTAMKVTRPVKRTASPMVRPIEAVNYFCELELDKMLKVLMMAEKAEEARQKDTVLVLPKIQSQHAILRLGETRNAMTEKQSEKSHLPPILSGPPPLGIGRAIKLVLPKVNLSPFPSAIDRYPLQPVFIMLRQSGQKYFILEHSYVADCT